MGSGARLLPPGSTVYTCMLNKRGGVESDLTVSRISPGDPASPLAPAFEGKNPEHGDAGVRHVSAPTVGLGGDHWGGFALPQFSSQSLPLPFSAVTMHTKTFPNPGKPWKQVRSEAHQHLLHPRHAQGAAGAGVIAFT